jgi:Ni,Fe-hydrogenase III large subunit
MTTLDNLGLRNRRAVPLAALPRQTVGQFRDALLESIRNRWRLVSLFGCPDAAGETLLIAVLGQDERGELTALSTVVGDSYPSLTPECPEAHLFEREIAEQCGVVPEGHPWLKPVRRHPPDHAARAPAGEPLDRERYPFFQTEGEEVHEVAVGPIHAGIIEPGHFRFQAHGEDVLFLEIMLGYQHRGVERLLETRRWPDAVLIAESIAGDTVIGHASAACGAIEALARSRKTPRAQSIRGIALELERLANHIGDLGAVAGDIAYQPAAAYFGRMRGECLNMLMAVSGNRYGRGLIRPGGVLFDISADMAADMRVRLQVLADELQPVGQQMLKNASVQARLEGVGVLSGKQCVELGLVGVAARACEVPRDVRHDHPYGLFRFAHIPVATAWAGDVLARILVRWLEVQRSLEFVIEQVGGLPRGSTQVVCGPLQPAELVVSLEEGWRGEIAHIVITDDMGDIRRHKVVDPSFHNWSAVAASMPGNQISDFPLCNKSFNLSYAGHDL